MYKAAQEEANASGTEAADANAADAPNDDDTIVDAEYEDVDGGDQDKKAS